MRLTTAMGTTVFTAASPMRVHHRHGAIRWPIVAAMAPGIVVGSLVGPQFASALPNRVLILPPVTAPARAPPLSDIPVAGQAISTPNVHPAPIEFDQRIAW